MDFLLTARRDEAAARRFFEQAIDLHDVPTTIAIDKTRANTAAALSLATDSGLPMGQLRCPGRNPLPAAQQFYSLTA